jgi:hypothetical protein
MPWPAFNPEKQHFIDSARPQARNLDRIRMAKTVAQFRAPTHRPYSELKLVLPSKTPANATAGFVIRMLRVLMA